MPNRIIKESICTSETIESLDSMTETFFYRIIVNCDDYGRMDARPAILRAKCFPLRVDKIKISEVEVWTKQLVAVGLLIIYSNQGKQYLQIPSWKEHQQIRAAKSKYPGLDDDGSILISDDTANNQVISDDIKNNQANSDVPVFDIRNSIIDNRNRNTESDTGPDGSPPKPKKTSESKKTFLEFVKLTGEEHSKLLVNLGESLTAEYIERLNGYIGQIGEKQAAKKYTSHYHTIANWWRKDGKPKDKSPPEKKPEPQSGLSYLRQKIDGG
jgi:hypothetical protein